MVRQKWGLDGKKIYFLDDKNDRYFHLISTNGKKKKPRLVGTFAQFLSVSF